MDTLFGVVILYNPTEEVFQNLASYSGALSKLYVFDNSEPAANIDLGGLGSNIVMIADGVNRGISERLNAAARMAIAEGGEWLLTMDQDSSFEKSEWENYHTCFSNFEGKEKVAMFGIEHEKKQEHNDTCSFEETDNLITSGSLVNLELFQQLQGFDENLFIDEVDFEYCVRANTNGFQTVRFNNVNLNHSLGTASVHRSLKNLQTTSRTLHSAFRLYYMVRNFLYVRKKYTTSHSPTFKYKSKDIWNRIKNNLLYGNERIKVFQYVRLGFRHFKTNTMGRLRR